MSTLLNESRREFLKQSAALSGGLVIALHLPGRAYPQAASAGAQEINAWVVVQPDDQVIVRIARSEMGQGSITGLPMLVAEELECDWGKVRPEFAAPAEHLRRNRAWVTMATGGSRSIRDSNEYLRKAGATAREMLVAAAAQKWGVPAAECRAENGIITHGPSGNKLRFGEVAEAAAKLPPPAEVKLKEPLQWKLIGKSMPRFDLPDKIAGKPVFGTDVQVPGMVHAAIAQCPVFGGKLKKYDDAAVMKRRGVLQVVPLEDAVAVVADNWWRAQEALNALPVEWDEGGARQATSESIRAFLRAGLALDNLPVAKKTGDAAKAFASAKQVIEAEYFAPYLNHATMEPMNCTAWVKGDRVEVWVPTQNGEASLAAASEAAGVPLANVEVHKMQLGGGFGRRGAFQDYVRQAVAISKAAGRPVKLMWSREQDMQHGFYRPASVVKMRAALGADGVPVAWEARIACQSILARVRPGDVKDGIDPVSVVCFSDLPYAVPNLQVDYALRNVHVPVGFWRAVGHSQNPFFRECFLDEIAAAGGKDPYELRRALLANAPKDLGVLEAAAKAAGWGRPLPRGVHRGIAVQNAYGSYAAAVIELSVTPEGKPDIKRVVVAVDPGYVVNPDSARAQIESCVVYGLTAALHGEITIRDGRVQQSNFHDYPMMRLKDMPKVESVLVPSGGFWGGMGEPPLAPLAPALCNAIFAATGKRIRSLPVKNHDLRKA
jgi:isoquinoline 1-oxidoreductase beta subunit